jgi:hypothetical protein
MNIPAMSMASSKNAVANTASLKVMKMTLDTVKQQGNDIANMISSTKVDVKI